MTTERNLPMRHEWSIGKLEEEINVMSMARSIFRNALTAAVLACVGSSAVPAYAEISNAQTLSILDIRSLNDVCEWNKIDWDDMNSLERNTWETLGWTRARWESDNPKMAPRSSFEDWNELTVRERQAALMLGYVAQTWEDKICSNAQTLNIVGVRSLNDVCEWNKIDWDDMNSLERNAWEALGWTRQRWESDNPTMAPRSSFDDWNDLTITERQAAVMLGYVAQTWEDKICQ